MTAVLFIHGFPFDHLLWRHQLEALSSWQCLAPDLRGAGTNVSAPGDGFSMAVYADDLIRQLDDAGADQAVVCGLSLGGYIVFELLRRFPQRVSAAILSNTKAAADTAEGKRGRDAMAARAQAAGVRGIAAELVSKVVARTTYERRPDVVNEVREMILRQPLVGVVGALRALRDRPDSTPLLAKISIPVLVVAGDDDQIAPADGMQEMARAIPGAQFVLIPDSGHLSPLEQPQAFNAALRAFL